MEDLLFEVVDGGAKLTFNRPNKRNALTTSMYEKIRDLLGDARRRDDIRVLVVTEKGSAFCAGSDIEDRLLYRISGERSASKRTLESLNCFQGVWFISWHDNRFAFF